MDPNDGNSGSDGAGRKRSFADMEAGQRQLVHELALERLLQAGQVQPIHNVNGLAPYHDQPTWNLQSGMSLLQSFEQAQTVLNQQTFHVQHVDRVLGQHSSTTVPSQALFHQSPASLLGLGGLQLADLWSASQRQHEQQHMLQSLQQQIGFLLQQSAPQPMQPVSFEDAILLFIRQHQQHRPPPEQPPWNALFHAVVNALHPPQEASVPAPPIVAGLPPQEAQLKPAPSKLPATKKRGNQARRPKDSGDAGAVEDTPVRRRPKAKLHWHVPSFVHVPRRKQHAYQVWIEPSAAPNHDHGRPGAVLPTQPPHMDRDEELCSSDAEQSASDTTASSLTTMWTPALRSKGRAVA